MEKRKLISLRAVLLGYLVQTAVSCIVAAVLWFLLFLFCIDSGWLLPANRAARVSNEAVQNILPYRTAKTFDPAELDPLCRYVLIDAEGNTVLATNMDSSHLQKAMREWTGDLRWEIGYEQYYLRARLQDGTFCLLQFDYAVPYADPALRDTLPDVQTMHLILGIFLLVGVVAWSTHRSGAFLRRETARLTEASRQVAEKKGIEDIDFTGAKVREYDEALRALQLMGEELTDSLQAQWEMEHRQRESIIQLSHKLKTPLTVIQGNAELLAEDEGMTGEQKAQLDAILRSTGETRNYLTRIRAEVQTPLKYKQRP